MLVKRIKDDRQHYNDIDNSLQFYDEYNYEDSEESSEDYDEDSDLLDLEYDMFRDQSFCVLDMSRRRSETLTSNRLCQNSKRRKSSDGVELILRPLSPIKPSDQADLSGSEDRGETLSGSDTQCENSPEVAIIFDSRTCEDQHSDVSVNENRTRRNQNSAIPVKSPTFEQLPKYIIREIETCDENLFRYLSSQQLDRYAIKELKSVDENLLECLSNQQLQKCRVRGIEASTENVRKCLSSEQLEKYTARERKNAAANAREHPSPKKLDKHFITEIKTSDENLLRYVTSEPYKRYTSRSVLTSGRHMLDCTPLEDADRYTASFKERHKELILYPLSSIPSPQKKHTFRIIYVRVGTK